MQTLTRHTVSLSLAALALASPRTGAQTAEERFPLTGANVMIALQAIGLAVPPADIRLPLSLTATSGSPALRVTSADVLPDGIMRVRLSCPRGECLPFFATVASHAKNSTLTEVAGTGSSFRPVEPIERVSRPALRAGDHATLVMEDDHMRISLSVVSIDSGTVGSEVRVSSPDHKKTFRATVLSSQLVKGDMP